MNFFRLEMCSYCKEKMILTTLIKYSQCVSTAAVLFWKTSGINPLHYKGHSLNLATNLIESFKHFNFVPIPLQLQIHEYACFFSSTLPLFSHHKGEN